MLNKSYLKFAIPLFAILLLVAGGYFVWDRFFKYDVMKVYQAAEKKYVEAMKADVYGGKTPKETLDLFVAALRANDIDLASKYFLLDENASREKWVEYLAAIEAKNLLSKMADDISRDAKPLGSVYEGNFAFGLFGNDGTVAISIRLRLNTHTKVWKIESL